MKFKRLMLVTLVLLAILTIGAASASDDAASDDLAVSDGDSVVAGPENDGGYDINPVIDPDDGEMNLLKEEMNLLRKFGLMIGEILPNKRIVLLV